MDVLKVILSNWKIILPIKNAIFTIFKFSETFVHLNIVKNITIVRLVGCRHIHDAQPKPSHQIDREK